MLKDSRKAELEAIEQVANLMLAAARTAPKTRGEDNIVTAVVGAGKLKKLIDKMKELGQKNNRPSFIRDANNLEKTSLIVLIGTKIKTLGLNCRFCGFETCAEATKNNSRCAYNALDLGIAASSAVEVAAKFHIDNRIMYSAGKTAIELGLLGPDIPMALGIPLSATGKNIYFDRN